MHVVETSEASEPLESRCHAGRMNMAECWRVSEVCPLWHDGSSSEGVEQKEQRQGHRENGLEQGVRARKAEVHARREEEGNR